MAKSNRKRVPILGLNGPPRCGKTFIMSKLQQMLPHATKISIQDGLFAYHQELGHAKGYSTYTEWKESPDFDRDSIIRSASHGRRTVGEYIFVDICERLPAFQEASVVIFDNIGFAADNYWARRVGDPYVLLRIDTPYDLPEPQKAEMRSLNTTWKGDSRRPFVNSHMLTAYDSTQMSLLLDYIANPEVDKAGTPYHEYEQLWNQRFNQRDQPRSAGRRRSTRVVGGLDV
ncbi:hypothetical protein Bpfe_031110 [Biomphalaria pfeifferi]|uniref:Uncharacterized protein n=1 Tax=Biomphalaria pfeifferi TaxID=112525 RepID=A0AAD8ANK6_BIOPF|nr:hypothetical protein Bpfe_031110 [Biomphalaria pfeifferi]